MSCDSVPGVANEGEHGRVVILNGSSSAGKSSVARILQSICEQRGECWLIFSWDDFIPRLPMRWHGGPDDVGDLCHEGVAYRVTSAPDAPAHALLLPGPLGRRVLRGYHRAIAALARSGINVLVEEVLISAEEWEDWNAALDGLATTWVGLRCDADTAARREHERGDRYVGLARGTTEVVHEHATYDIEVDTSTLTADQAAAAIDVALHHHAEADRASGDRS